jgi:hypothetical protein
MVGSAPGTRTVSGANILSPFVPTNAPGSSFRTYARGTGGLTDLCTLYGVEPFNPCGGVVPDDCPNQVLYIAIIVAILALLWIQTPSGSA